MRLIKMIGRIHWLWDESVGVWYKRIDFDGRLVEVSVVDVPSVVMGLVVVAPKEVVPVPSVAESVEPVSEVVAKVVLLKKFVTTKGVVGVRAMQKRRKALGLNRPVGRPRLKDYDMEVIVGEVKGGASVSEVCGKYGISRSVYYDYVRPVIEKG